MPRKSEIKSKPNGSPFTLHRNGQWCKKIRGRIHYFGTDHAQALNRYREYASDLHAGIVVQSRRDLLRVKTMIELFLDFKQDALDSGNINDRTMKVYREMAAMVGRAMTGRTANQVTPADFAKLMSMAAKSWGHTRRRNLVTFTRMLFKWGLESRLLDRPADFGPSFRPPPKKIMRGIRRQAGSLMFTAQQVRDMIALAAPQMRAMILLGINAGFGTTDCACLPLRSVSFKNRLIDFPRPKTGIDRLIPIWPETSFAIRCAVDSRAGIQAVSKSQTVFITRGGNRWVHGNTDAIGQEFGKILDAMKITIKGVGFYTLRRTFRTIADNIPDTPAIDRIMGHATVGMGAHYVQKISHERLLAVTGYVRDWLFEFT